MMRTSTIQTVGEVFCEYLLSNGIRKDNSNFVFICRHFTREALPRLDNYRNILSVQAVYRPTLDDLHNATMSFKVKFNYLFRID